MTILGHGATNISLGWEPVWPNVTSTYVVYYSGSQGSDVVQNGSMASNATNLEIQGLHSFTNYTLWVVAYIGDGNMTSEPVYVMTDREGENIGSNTYSKNLRTT